MIKRNYLLEWAKSFPWSHDEFVEQDLLISRCIVAIYSDPFLASRLAWRDGTALYKLYVTPQPRYSEDIDLVLINPESMGPILDRLRNVLSMEGLLRPGIEFDAVAAWANVKSGIVDRLMTESRRSRRLRGNTGRS